MTSGQILIVSDDSEFVRSLTARWRMENDSPAITAVSTGVSPQASSSGYEMIVIGPLRNCAALPAGPALHPDSVMCAVGDEESLKVVRAANPGWLLLPECPGWPRILFSLAGEVLRRKAAEARARSGNRKSGAKAFWHSRQIPPGGAPRNGQCHHLSSRERGSDSALR
jgi:hypothetical protein